MKIRVAVPPFRLLLDILVPVLLVALAINLDGLPTLVRIGLGVLGGALGGRTYVMILIAARSVRDNQQAQLVHDGASPEHGVSIVGRLCGNGAVVVESEACLELSRAQKATVMGCVEVHVREQVQILTAEAA